jgi:hypothetical protein
MHLGERSLPHPDPRRRNREWSEHVIEVFKRASGSPVLVRSQNGALTIKGVHVGGGQDAADYTDFTLDDASPKGRSYSNALQLDQDILDEIRRFETEKQITQTR